MRNLTQIPLRFFRVMINLQAYLNMIYLFAAFPLSVFYFIFLVSGLSTGLSLLIIWIGIPILLVVGIGWWAMARFERFLAIHWLKENVPVMTHPSDQDDDIWAYLKSYIVNPVTWKSLVYLLAKFPLGIGTFVIQVTLVCLTLAFLTMPLTYELIPNIQISGFFTQGGQPVWQVDTMVDALLGTLIGIFLWPLTLQISNGLAWVHAKFARVMLSIDPNLRLELLLGS